MPFVYLLASEDAQHNNIPCFLLVTLVPMEIRFFHGVSRKAFRGPTHKMMWAIEASFIGMIKTTAPRCPTSHPRPGNSAQSCCQRSPAFEPEARCCPHLTKPRRSTRAQRCRAIIPASASKFSVVQLSLCPHPAGFRGYPWACTCVWGAATEKNARTHTWTWSCCYALILCP